MKRGDIHWVSEMTSEGSEIRKNTPWLIMSVDSVNRGRLTIVGIPLTTSAAPNDIAIQINDSGQLVVAVCDQIRAITKKNIDPKPKSTLSAYDLAAVEEGVKKVLGL